MAKKIYKRILIQEEQLSDDLWQRQYKKVLDEEAMAQAAAEEKAKAAPKKAPVKKAVPKKVSTKKAPAKKSSK